MGIKRLNTLFRQKCADIFKRVHLSEFSDKFIALDTAYFIYRFKECGSYKESILNMLRTFERFNVTPIFVIDGSCPKEKRDERINRSNRKRMLYDRVERLERDLCDYLDTGTVSSELQELYEFKIRRRNVNLSSFDYDNAKRHVDKMRSRMINVNGDDFRILEDLAKCFNANVIVADTEAEIYCAKLCRNGLVDAVYTRDTDIYACLCPRVITDHDDSNVVVVELKDIMEGLKLEASSFVDMCIMCGTDFNKNIPRIGSIRAYELIRQYGSIENVRDKTNYDVSTLNFRRVREIFRTDGVLSAATTFSRIKRDDDLLSKWIS